MKKLLIYISLLSASILVNASELSDLKMGEVKVNDSQYTLLKTIEHQKKVSWSMAPAKSKEALYEISREKSPLDLLSSGAKERFIESIVFNNNGIGGFKYGELEAELTPSQIYSILSLIGAQHTVSMLKNARIESENDLLLLSAPELKFNDNPSVNSFGRPGRRFADHKEYECASSHTCRKASDAICMSGC